MRYVLMFMFTLLLAGTVAAADVEDLIRLNDEGTQAYHHSDYPTALQKWEQGLKLARQLKHQQGISTFIGNLGVAYDDFGQYAKALEYYEQALEIKREIGDRKGEADNLGNIGLVYQSLSQYTKALEYYEQALTVDREIGYHQGESADLSNIGNVHESLGQYAKALKYYEQALAIRRKIGDRNGEGSDLGNIGLVHDNLGQYAKALKYYEQALVIFRELGNRQGEGISLTNIGNVYLALNQYSKALKYCEQALVIRRELGNRQGEGADLTNIGNVYQSLSQYAKALEYYEQALVIDREIGYRKGVGNNLTNIGLVYGKLSQYAKALEYLEQALAIWRDIGDRAREGRDLNNIGVVYEKQGDYSKARATYQQALQIVTTTGEPDNLWRIWMNLFDVSKSLDNPLAAIFYGKQAVNTLQTMRGQVAKLEDKSLYLSFFKEKIPVYRALADLLISQGRLLEAQQILELLKEEEYFEYSDKRREVLKRSNLAVFMPLEQQQDTALQAASAELIRLGREYQDLYRLPYRDEAQQARLKELDQALQTSGKAFLAFLPSLESSFAQAAGQPSSAADQAQLAKLRGLQETLRHLGQDVALLHYVLMDDKLHILFTNTDPQTPLARQVTLKADDLNCAVANFRALLAKSGTLSACNSPNTPKALAQHLYNLLIAPVAEELRQTKTLLLYLDGSLRYVPFAALRDGEQWLAERYAIGIYTAVAQDKLKHPRQADWQVAGLGVTKGHKKGHKEFAPLPGVREELHALVRTPDSPNGLLPGVVHLDEAFNQPLFSKLLEKQQQTVFHLASHFSLQPGSYRDSFLLLGDGSQFNLQNLLELPFNFDKLDLITLSACNTAAGGTGAEIEGFGTLAQNKGAKSVLASLWPVNDQSTSAWMQAFYAAREEQGLSKLAAMRQAQLALLANENTEHPQHWAAFILMGNGQ